MPSLTYLRLSDAWLIFSFQFSLLFFHISIARQHQHCGLGLLLVLIRNIAHRMLLKIWAGTFPVWRKDFGFILTVKWHPAVGQFSNEFPTICNRCRVMMAWNRKTYIFLAIFAFFEKRPLMVQFSKFCSERFHRLVVFQCRKIYLTGNRRNLALFTWQKISAACRTVATARFATKTYQGQPPTICS